MAQVDARDTGSDDDPLGAIQHIERERQVVTRALGEDSRKTSGLRLSGQRDDVCPPSGMVVGKEERLLDHRDLPIAQIVPVTGAVSFGRRSSCKVAL